jgi:hypothetical protein
MLRAIRSLVQRYGKVLKHQKVKKVRYKCGSANGYFSNFIVFPPRSRRPFHVKWSKCRPCASRLSSTAEQVPECLWVCELDDKRHKLANKELIQGSEKNIWT